MTVECPNERQQCPQRFVIVGAGAVGGSVGALLAAAGRSVVLVARGAHAAAVQRDGLRVRLPDRELRAVLPCVTSPAQVDWRAGDVVLLATKLQDARPALEALRAAAGPRVPVACLCNGVHGESWAAERFATVLSVLLWLPAAHLEPGQVMLYASGCLGVLDVGVHCAAEADAASAWADALAAAFGDAGFDSCRRDDIASWKRAKWLCNLGGAAQALVVDDWQVVAAAARAEGVATLAAAGLACVPEATFQARVAVVRPVTIDGRERPGGSTWQSRARGVPLESAWLEGAMARLAEQVGQPAPINARLAALALVGRSAPAGEVLAI